MVTALAYLAFTPIVFAAPQTTAISEAQLFEAAAAGGSLVLPAGQIVLSRPLVITRDFRLSGAGPEDTTIQYAGSGAAVRIVGGASVNFDNLRIDASGSSEVGAFGADLIQVLDGRLVLDRIYLSGARYAAPDDLKPYGYGSALFVAGSSTATVTGTLFQFNELVAVEVTGAASVDLRQTSFDRNVHGAFAEQDAVLTVIDSLFVATEESALSVRGRVTATISSNTFSVNGVDPATNHADFDALRFGEEATVSLRDNLIEGNPRYALSLFGTAAVTAAGNTYRSNGGHDEVADVIRSTLL
ncbi:MAG TPA: right-handed parallel beta-helix repeat-containing protein, partial [Trueperaceae bacterium]|nr:right-handed parallel beta-helix repeat-containing protein [Trueperaceae bacterium]